MKRVFEQLFRTNEIEKVDLRKVGIIELGVGLNSPSSTIPIIHFFPQFSQILEYQEIKDIYIDEFFREEDFLNMLREIISKQTKEIHQSINGYKEPEIMSSIKWLFDCS